MSSRSVPTLPNTELHSLPSAYRSDGIACSGSPSWCGPTSCRRSSERSCSSRSLWRQTPQPEHTTRAKMICACARAVIGTEGSSETHSHVCLPCGQHMSTLHPLLFLLPNWATFLVANPATLCRILRLIRSSTQLQHTSNHMPNSPTVTPASLSATKALRLKTHIFAAVLRLPQLLSHRSLLSLLLCLRPSIKGGMRSQVAECTWSYQHVSTVGRQRQ